MRMFKLRIAKEAEEREQLISVRGTLSNIFTNAIDAALSNEQPPEVQSEVASIVAMESAQQDASIVNAIVSKLGQGYTMNNDPKKQVVGTGKILVDVISGDAPDQEDLSQSAQTLADLEANESPIENYIPIIVYDATTEEGTNETYQPLVKGLENMAAKLGVKVYHFKKVAKQ